MSLKKGMSFEFLKEIEAGKPEQMLTESSERKVKEVQSAAEKQAVADALQAEPQKEEDKKKQEPLVPMSLQDLLAMGKEGIVKAIKSGDKDTLASLKALQKSCCGYFNKEEKKDIKKKAPKGVNPEKHERCVRAVKEQGKSVGSAHAICTASMKKGEDIILKPNQYKVKETSDNESFNNKVEAIQKPASYDQQKKRSMRSSPLKGSYSVSAELKDNLVDWVKQKEPKKELAALESREKSLKEAKERFKEHEAWLKSDKKKLDKSEDKVATWVKSSLEKAAPTSYNQKKQSEIKAPKAPAPVKAPKAKPESYGNQVQMKKSEELVNGWIKKSDIETAQQLHMTSFNNLKKKETGSPIVKEDPKSEQPLVKMTPAEIEVMTGVNSPSESSASGAFVGKDNLPHNMSFADARKLEGR